MGSSTSMARGRTRIRFAISLRSIGVSSATACMAQSRVERRTQQVFLVRREDPSVSGTVMNVVGSNRVVIMTVMYVVHR